MVFVQQLFITGFLFVKWLLSDGLYKFICGFCLVFACYIGKISPVLAENCEFYKDTLRLCGFTVIPVCIGHFSCVQY